MLNQRSWGCEQHESTVISASMALVGTNGV